MNQETLEKPQGASLLNLFNLFDQADETIARNNRTIAMLRATRPHIEKLVDALERHDTPDVQTQNVQQMIAEGTRLGRMNELVSIAEFIGTASLLECKHIINELIDRTSTITGCATELENAACSLTRSIEIDGGVEGDAADSLRAYSESQDEL